MASLSESPTLAIDVDAVIAEFLVDEFRSLLELPNLTASQRKQAKHVVERHPQLTCESFGFGAERQLHIFKKAESIAPVISGSQTREAANCAFSVKNTFIDDFIAANGNDEPPEPVVFRSMPPQLNNNLVQTCLTAHASSLDLPPIKERTCDDRSTAASVSTPAIASPASSTRELLTEHSFPPGLPLPPGLQVRNTFIHVDSEEANCREVQSMPHGMFGQCLMAELEERKSSHNAVPVAPEIKRPSVIPPVEHDLALHPGTEVVIDGLQKLPAFNGVQGIVQSFDQDSLRYSILLKTPANGHKWAKVKRENIQVVFAPPPPTFAPTLGPLEDHSFVQHGYPGFQELPPTPMWDEYARKPRLNLTALV